MNRWKFWSLILLVIAAGLLIGNWLGKGAAGAERTAGASPTSDSKRTRPLDDPRPPAARTGDRDEDGGTATDPDAPEGAIPGQRTVTFASAEAMRRFLASLEGTGIVVLGSIDALNTLRLGVRDASALAALLDGSEEIGYIFPAEIPGKASFQQDATPFGRDFLKWLGADGDRTTWGDGVRIAVLDTGVIADPAFAHRVISSNLVALPDDPSTMNSHGTAVAALIAGIDGLAPGASILDYRIARDDGTSDTFLIAQAILAATDAGADIINISLGAAGRSVLLEQAVNYASQAGVVVVASAGNNGLDYLFYPAAYENVVGVGAVDARGEHLLFSNTGETSIVAPGLALNSTAGNGTPISFSGTSASSPVVAGAIAAVMTQQQTNASNAWQQVQSSANEAGAPGNDPAYGAGILDVGRTLNSKVPGISDAALAANYVTTNPQGNPIVQVTVENRGTAPIVNAPVTVSTPMGVSQLNVTTLAPGAIQTFELPLGSSDQGFRIESSVGLSGGTIDQNPANNRRIDVVVPQESP